jgi:transcriptional regulator with XRE-family HTH domain
MQQDHFHERLAELIQSVGLARVAEAANVSRPALTRLAKTKAAPTREMRAKLKVACTLLARLEQSAGAKRDAVLARLRQQASLHGLIQLASELGIDRGNLSAMLAGRRPLNRRVRQMLGK